VEAVVSNIERHSSLFRNEVTLRHIQEEHEARTRLLAHFDQETEFQDREKFKALRTQVSPVTYDRRLDWLLNRSCDNSAEWLLQDDRFLAWIDISNRATRLLWLQGIPGAGRLPALAIVLPSLPRISLRY